MMMTPVATLAAARLHRVRLTSVERGAASPHQGCHCDCCALLLLLLLCLVVVHCMLVAGCLRAASAEG
jgi:hypothetical protein